MMRGEERRGDERRGEIWRNCWLVLIFDFAYSHIRQRVICHMKLTKTRKAEQAAR